MTGSESPRDRAAYVNAHTHLYSGLVPFGMPAPAPEPSCFVEILERVWWRLDRALDADSLRASAFWYVAEAVRAGTIGLIDHHESPEFIDGSLDVLADACQAFGVRALVCYGATERNRGADEARAGLAECRRFIRDNDRDLVRGLVGLHACFTVSDQTIRDAADLARELDTVLHVHVAEDLADVNDARARGYAGVVDRLRVLDALVPGSIFAHGVHAAEHEVRVLAEHGCWLVHNPRSNRGNKVGYARVLGASERVALGTDGYPSDMLAEERALCELALEHGDTVAPTANRLRAGTQLLAERFGFSIEALEQQTQTRLPGDSEWTELRAQATEQAARLWRRMENI